MRTLLIILILLTSCRTVNKSKDLQKTDLTEKTQITKQKHDISKLIELQKTLDYAKAFRFNSYLNLTPLDSTKPAIIRHYKDNKEVSRTEVENASYKESKSHSDTIYIRDSIFVQNQFTYSKKQLDSLINIAVSQEINKYKKEVKGTSFGFGLGFWLTVIICLVALILLRYFRIT